jgi:hypothetical protein
MFVITGLVPVIHGSYDTDIDRSGVHGWPDQVRP